MADNRLSQSMLLDFYGELLTQKQRECYDLHFNEDLSLSEIAEQLGISRQGVWDNIRRAQSAMEDMENKTGIISRFLENRDALERLKSRMLELGSITQGRAGEISRQAAEEIEALIRRG